METKICTGCHQELSTTLFGLRDNKVLPRCKECNKAYQKTYRAGNKEKIKSKNKAYREAHKGELKEYYKEWQVANLSKFREYNKKYYENNKVKVCARTAEYQKQNPLVQARSAKKWRENNQPAITARMREYRAKNPNAMRIINNRRKARLLDAEGSWDMSDLSKMYETQEGKCFYCKKEMGSNFHVEHSTPLCRGGSNYPSNLTLTCPKCNHEKNVKTHDEYVKYLKNVRDIIYSPLHN